MLPECVVQVKSVRKGPAAGQCCGEAELIAVAIIQGVLAGLHIRHIGGLGSVQPEGLGYFPFARCCYCLS